MLPIQNIPSLSPNAPGLRQGSAGTAQGFGSSGGGNDSQRALSELQTRAIDQLARQVPGLGNAQAMAKLSPADFTPERVSERIAGFVNTGLNLARARGASETELQSLQDQALRGVERGFREARDILKGLNVLNGKIADDVDRTEQLTFDRLLGRNTPTRSELQQTDSLRFTAVQRFQQADDFSLRMTTRSGKEISLEFSRGFELSANAQIQAGASQVSKSLDVSRYEATGYGFSVKGDLTEAEQRAVQNLVQDIGRLANDFFNGDVQQAFDQLGSLRFDSQQLASMELNLTRTETRTETYTLAQSYAQTQRLAASDESNTLRPVQRLGQLLQEMRDSFNASLLEFLDRPQLAAGDLMRNLVAQDARFKGASDDQQTRFQQNLDRLLDAVQSMGSRSPVVET